MVTERGTYVLQGDELNMTNEHPRMIALRQRFDRIGCVDPRDQAKVIVMVYWVNADGTAMISYDEEPLRISLSN